jgi:hypothetical protein
LVEQRTQAGEPTEYKRTGKRERKQRKRKRQNRTQKSRFTYAKFGWDCNSQRERKKDDW